MELRLQQLIDRLYKVAELRNLSDENPIKVTLENPNIQGTTIVVISVFEPYVYPLPYNVVWISADANSTHYRTALKRVSKSPNGATPSLQHTWSTITTFADFFHPPQYYDSADTTPEDVLHQSFVDHMQSINNPHNVTAQQAQALPLQGGVLTGPLYLSRSPVDTTEASHKGYVDTKLGLLATSITNVNNSLLSQIVRVDGVESDITALENSLNTYVSRPGQLKGFRYTQTMPNVTWYIPHNLNSDFISVQVYDVSGEMVYPDKVVRNSVNNTTVSFLSAVSGIAVVTSVNP